MNAIRAASVQFQHLPGDKEANLATVRSFSAQAATEQVDLLVFPEMCITGYWHVRNLSREEIDALAEPVPDGPTTEALVSLASECGMTIGAGLIERGEIDMAPFVTDVFALERVSEGLEPACCWASLGWRDHSRRYHFGRLIGPISAH